ncbi:hypothetical protein CR513_50300, partial [Mucuna pruriens]
MSLNGTNYHLWKEKIKDLLFVKKMHLHVFAAQKPESMSDEEWDFEHQQDHLNEFQGIIDQMSGMGIKFEDEILGLLLLNSLPESWETFKVSITNSIPNGVVSLQMVKGSVLNEEMRRKTQDKEGKSKEKDDDDDDDDHDHDHHHVTTATGDGLVILRYFESVNLVSDESIDATLHVTPRKEFFTSYTVGDFGVLKMGNDGVTKVIGVGDVCLQTNTGMQL